MFKRYSYFNSIGYLKFDVKYIPDNLPKDICFNMYPINNIRHHFKSHLALEPVRGIWLPTNLIVDCSGDRHSVISTTLTLASATRFSWRVLHAMVSSWMITSSVACAFVTARSSRPCLMKRTMPCYSCMHVREGKNSLATSQRLGTCHAIGVQSSTLIGPHRPPSGLCGCPVKAVSEKHVHNTDHLRAHCKLGQCLCLRLL